ncbi:MAG: L-arabinose isomerase [Capsulimonadaceae bacterium]|nr:L-arabinose isomerase [Capsulimonadaceae bacterium]
MTNHAKKASLWFLTGSQHLYGPAALAEVAVHSRQIAEALGESLGAVAVQFKPVLTGPDEIRNIIREANAADECIGIVTWMHTFSPAKMWIAGLSELQKPLLHLHTQFNRDIPWSTIDMDFMNLNQAAHGDREYGFIGARMDIPRKIVVGHWQSPDVIADIASWAGVALGHAESRRLKIARFGDNMREVAVTEGDKVEAQIKFGWSTNGYGVGDLVKLVNAFSDAEVENVLKEYEALYDFAPILRSAGPGRDSVKVQARIELGLRAFLAQGDFGAFTTTFEDLHGLDQLPGLAVQRLMSDGYGFAGEGDWKTAGLVRVMKTMAGGKKTSFMEDYTYNLESGNELVLGSHMLEVCPSIASNRPRIEVHPLGIGGKADPARLVFNGLSGRGICASMIDMGSRFRLIVNELNAVPAPQDMPNLPVARILWKPEPSLRVAAEAWIQAGGAHHTSLSLALTSGQLSDWAEIVGIECVIIDSETRPLAFRNELRRNRAAWLPR